MTAETSSLQNLPLPLPSGEVQLWANKNPWTGLYQIFCNVNNNCDSFHSCVKLYSFQLSQCYPVPVAKVKVCMTLYIPWNKSLCYLKVWSHGVFVRKVMCCVQPNKWKFTFALFSVKWIIFRSFVFWLFMKKGCVKILPCKWKRSHLDFFACILEPRWTIYYFLCFPVKSFGKNLFPSFDFKDTDNCQNKRSCLGWI